MTRYLTPLWAVAVTLVTLSASAHPLKPGLLRIDPSVSVPGELDVMLKLPGTGDQVAPVTVRFPSGCAQSTKPTQQAVNAAMIQRWRVRCDAATLASEPLRFESLSRKVGEVLVLYPSEDGVTRSVVARAEAPSVTLDPETSPGLTAYLGLGVEHILGGIDHLLFVLGLMMLVFGRYVGRAATMKLLWTISAFTLAHSLTLGAATLGWVRVPSDAVETVIAMSIVLLAVELARPTSQSPSFTTSHPAAVAFAFGLLHGFGFAGALTELGVPEDSVLGALLLFNVGVEIGQIAFVLVVGLLWQAVRRSPAQLIAWGHAGVVHALGGVAVYWCLDRGAALLERLLSS